jgi:hypothetical protein
MRLVHRERPFGRTANLSRRARPIRGKSSVEALVRHFSAERSVSGAPIVAGTRRARRAPGVQWRYAGAPRAVRKAAAMSRVADSAPSG